jgi:hypothetical protein
MRDRAAGHSVEVIAKPRSVRRNQMLRSRAHKTIATLMVAFAILVPAAHARPVDSPGVGTAPSSAQHHQPSSDLPPGVDRTASGANPTAPSNATNSPASSTSSSDFDWGDAGIGAAAMLLLVSVGAGGVLAIRRSRGSGRPVLTS